MDMLSALQKQQDDKFDRVLSSINEVKLSVDSMSEKYNEVLQRLVLLEEEKKDYIANIQQLENKIEVLERNARCTSIEIRNIPQGKKESKQELISIIKNTAEALDVQLQSAEIKDVYRINTKAANKPIVADFTTVFRKDSFIASVKKYNKEHQQNKLSTSSINISGPTQPVYISENLTQKDRKLHYLARELAKKYGYSYCWVSFGKVYIRKAEGLPQIRIACESDLDKLEVNRQD